MVVALSINIRHQRLQSPPPPPPPGAQPLMIAGGDNLPGANVNETNPAGVNHVPNGAGDEAANNGVAVDDPANNRGDNLDERELAFDLHQSSASEGDSSDDYQDDSEEDEDDVEEAGRWVSFLHLSYNIILYQFTSSNLFVFTLAYTNL